jgi:hypothetical protein
LLYLFNRALGLFWLYCFNLFYVIYLYCESRASTNGVYLVLAAVSLLFLEYLTPLFSNSFPLWRTYIRINQRL